MSAVRTDHLELRSVKVSIDESGRDQRLAQVDDVTAGMFGPITAIDDAARVNCKIAVVVRDEARRDSCREGIRNRREYTRAVDLHARILQAALQLLFLRCRSDELLEHE